MGSAIQPARGDGENSPSSSLWGLEGWTEGSLGSTESRIRGSLYPEPPSSPQGLPSHPQVEGALVELGGWEEVEGQLQSRGGCLGDCGVGGEGEVVAKAGPVCLCTAAGPSPARPELPHSPTGAFCIPLYVPYVLTGRWPFSRGLCKLWLVVDYLLCTSSVFNIVLISYDRFLSVTHAVSSGPGGPNSCPGVGVSAVAPGGTRQGIATSEWWALPAELGPHQPHS